MQEYFGGLFPYISWVLGRSTAAFFQFDVIFDLGVDHMHFDILVVGAGLFGSVIAREAIDSGKTVLVIDKRDHIGGNCYTESIENINVHKYGAHIFRTNDDSIWNYMKRFCVLNNFINTPIANYHGELYNMPFNMNTFHALWGVNTPAEAKAVIDSQRIACDNPSNLEEHILDLVGKDIYEKLVKGYTEKQWGKPCRELPPSIMRRIPLRFTFNNNYFNDFYQGIPIGGYTKVIDKMLHGAVVRLGVDYTNNRQELNSISDTIVYTGTIDQYYDFKFGPLEYRSLRFEHETVNSENYQGVAVMNFTDAETPYTRIIEHKHFERTQSAQTVISREYPISWTRGADPYYPMEDNQNRSRYNQYLELANSETRVHFGGRLGEYRYYDMQDTIKSALKCYKMWFGELDSM